jgi:hypothetical protein
VGSPGTERQITNVADGTAGTDAVNMRQLNQMGNQLGSRIDKVGAMSAAMSALEPLGYDPDQPTQISLGGGQYNGQTAAAIGIHHYTNNSVLLNVGFAISGGEKMARAGVTWKMGKSKAKETAADTKATPTATGSSTGSVTTAATGENTTTPVTGTADGGSSSAPTPATTSDAATNANSTAETLKEAI